MIDFLLLSGWGKSGADAVLICSELLLLVFAAIVAGGVLGETTKAKRWQPWHHTFGLIVFLGVAGETIADAGVFIASARLQEISDAEVATATKTASEAIGRAAALEKEAADTRVRAARLEKEAETERLARAKIEDRLAHRSIADSAQPAFLDALRPHKGQEYSLWIAAGNEAESFACSVDALLRTSGWRPHSPKMGETVTGIFLSPCGDGYARPDNITDVMVGLRPNPTEQTNNAAKALTGALKAANIVVRSARINEDELPDGTVGLIIGKKEP